MQQLTYLGPGHLESRDVPAPRLQGAGRRVAWQDALTALVDVDQKLVISR